MNYEECRDKTLVNLAEQQGKVKEHQLLLHFPDIANTQVDTAYLVV